MAALQLLTKIIERTIFTVQLNDMNKVDKLTVSLVGIAVFVGALAIRLESLIIVPTLFTLLIIFICRPKIGLSGLLPLIIILFPGGNTGYLYGRDTHGLTRIALEIQNSGWPIEGVRYVWGDPTTPLSHIQLIIFSNISDLPYYPGETSQVLISSFLPYVYILVSVFSVICVARRRFSLRFSLKYILPIVLWMPLYSNYSAPRRGSLGIALFSVFLLSIYISRNDSRIGTFIPVLVMALVANHHVGAFFGITLLSIFTLLNPKYLRYTIISLILVSLWYLFVTTRGVLFLTIAASFVLETSISTGGFSQVEQSILDTLQSWAPRVFIGLIATVLSIFQILDYIKKNQVNIDIVSYLFAVLVGILTISMIIGDGGLSIIRSGTYFILVCSWLAFGKLRISLDTSFRSGNVLVMIFSLLLVVSAVFMIHPGFVTEYSPTEEETTQRFGTTTYSVGEFSQKYATRTFVVADANIIEVVVPRAQLLGQTNLTVLSSGQVPEDSYVILADRNEYMVFGPTSDGWGKVKIDGIFSNYNHRSSRIYDSGSKNIYV